MAIATENEKIITVNLFNIEKKKYILSNDEEDFDL
jgi:hypothetical protein